MNRENYKIIERGGQAEIVEKKSRFLVSIEAVTSEEEAIAYIEACKKKYWNATHNCSAFIIGSNAEIVRCQDDGEPSGTAGRPMLDVLMGAGVRNVVAVVTRYFGGTLLGTGGLVRAYGGAVKEGLANCRIETMIYGVQYKLTVDYKGIGKIQYLLAQRKIKIMNSIFEEQVEVLIIVSKIVAKELLEELTEAINGKLVIEEIASLFFIDK